MKNSKIKDEEEDSIHSSKKVTNNNTVAPIMPKQQNTVFIHKLYNILQNPDLHHLIWWSNTGLSFYIKPNEKFSKTLATYFKHTNITSFVRQLNIYGFHKVNNNITKNNLSRERENTDHTIESIENNGNNNSNSGNNNSNNDQIKIWEFKHTAGLFKNGDLNSLKLIKRRSSSRNNLPLLNSNNSNNNNPLSNSSNVIRKNSGTNSNVDMEYYYANNSNNNTGTINYINNDINKVYSMNNIHSTNNNNIYNGTPNNTNNSIAYSRSSDSLPSLNQRISIQNNNDNKNINSNTNNNTGNNNDNINNNNNNSSSTMINNPGFLIENIKSINLDMVNIIDIMEKLLNSNNNSDIILKSELQQVRNNMIRRLNAFNMNVHYDTIDSNNNNQDSNSYLTMIYKPSPIINNSTNNNNNNIPPQIINYAGSPHQMIASIPPNSNSVHSIMPIQYNNLPVQINNSNNNNNSYNNIITPSNSESHIMMNPFEIRNKSRNDNLQQNAANPNSNMKNKRNMSVLVDPLTPVIINNNNANNTNNNFMQNIPPIVRPVPISQHIPATTTNNNNNNNNNNINNINHSNSNNNIPVDPHRRFTPENLNTDAFKKKIPTPLSNHNSISAPSSLSLSSAAAAATITAETNSKSLSNINEEPKVNSPNNQILTPQNSISLDKNEKSLVNKELQKKPSINTNATYKVHSLLNEKNVTETSSHSTYSASSPSTTTTTNAPTTTASIDDDKHVNKKSKP